MTDAPSISEERVREGKAPSTRLLDMLAGWEAYVKADEEQGVVDLALSSKELHELYRLAGEMSLVWEHLSLQRQSEAIRTFVLEQILPTVLHTPPNDLDSTPHA